MNSKIGILLINLGTPLSPKPKDVYTYLIEFLTDPRVIDLSWIKRQFLVRGVIVPSRYRQSAKAYKEIWTSEGSPLLIHTQELSKKLQKKLGKNYSVEIAMRYQEPSIQKSLRNLLKKNIDKLIVLPLFPQYASATTGSVLEAVQKELSQYSFIPETKLISFYPTEPKMIEAFCSRIQEYDLSKYDLLLFSFHGLPKRQIFKADSQNFCLKTLNCCKQLCNQNKHCYSAQCHATAEAIIKRLNIPLEKTKICFQSRLGKEPWLQPYTSTVLEECIREGKKRILVCSPAFVSDCLETIYEIKEEYAQEFIKAGGEALDLVTALNDHPLWIESLSSLIET